MIKLFFVENFIDEPREEIGELWKTLWVGLKLFCKMCLCFLKKSDILKSVDEHPHKQVKNYINIKRKSKVANTKL